MNLKQFYLPLIIVIVLSSCDKAGKDSIYILPKNYQGVVFVIYNQNSGQQPKYENGNRLYEIPSGGILKTQFKPNVGWRSSDKFYYADNDNRIEILYEQQPKTIKGDSIKVCCFSSGTSSVNPSDSTQQIHFAMFYIGAEKNLDSIYEQGEKINPATLIKE